MVQTWIDQDTTPAVNYGDHFKCENTLATSITAFDNGQEGQTFKVLFTTANTTLTQGASLQLAGSVNYNPPADTLMEFIYIDSTWREVSRVEP